MIGSNLVHYLIDNTDDFVISIDNFRGGYVDNLPKPSNRHVIIAKDVYKSHLELVFNSYQPTIVYHLAAYAAECLSPFIRRYNYINNLVGTTSIVNYCINHNVERLIFFSSIAVYGKGYLNRPFIEEQVPRPQDPYGVAKYASEMDIQIAGTQHGLKYTILRPFNIYGERQDIWDKYRNVLGIWMLKYMKGEKLPIFGDGTQLRNFTYIGDLLEPFYRISTEDIFTNHIINIGSDKTYSVREAADILIEVMGGGEVEHLPPRHEVKEAICDLQLQKSFGIDPKTELKEGLEKMWEWAKTKKRKSRNMRSYYEITKGMYNSWKNE